MRSFINDVCTASAKAMVKMAKRRDGMSRSRRGYFSV
jgi:hypothetical protein